MAYQNNKKYDDAEKLIISRYEEKTDDYNKKLILLLGKNYFLTNNFNGAINLFKEYINTYPDEVAGFYNLGLSFLKLGDAAAALENFLKAYDIDKSFVPVLYNVSNYYYNEKLYKEALPYVASLAQKESNNDMVLYMYARILYELGEYETSLEYAKKCYTIDNKNKDYYLLTARNYAKGFEDKKNTFYFIDKALEVGCKPSELAEVEEFAVIKETYKNEYNELLKKYVK
jgi:tetratricopeptide (TPR) repeat protein